MAYIDPKSVVSPKHIVDEVEVVFDAGPVEQSWAVATLSWDHKDAVGIRWNGEPGGKGIGIRRRAGCRLGSSFRKSCRIPSWKRLAS